MVQAISKHDLYVKAFLNTVASDDYESTDSIKKMIFYGVKAINSIPDRNVKYLRCNFQFIETIQQMMGTLKPLEFVNIFPITKEYDGSKYQTKDYFYTRDYIKTLPDEPIGDADSVINFLWEYQNNDIRFFVVNMFGAVSDLRKSQGQPGIMEEWCAENGIKTYTMHTDQKGKEFMVDNETGKSFRIKRKMPRYLRLIR